MESRSINEHYAEIGMELFQNEETFANIKISNATIVFLSSQHKKNSNVKPVLGQCERIQEKYKCGIPCDFTITLFEPNLEGMTEEQIKIENISMFYNFDGEKISSIDFEGIYKPQESIETPTNYMNLDIILVNR